MRKYILILAGLLIGSVNVFAQVPSVSQNYVVETTVRTSNKKDTSHLVGLPVEQANRNIQYLDGLGRPLQTVQWKGSPLKRDIVQPVVYDAFGREAIKYLPYADNGTADGGLRSTALSSQTSFYSTGSWDANIVKTPFPYSKTVFEASPLNRVLEQGAPGATWQPAVSRTTTGGRTVVQGYAVNSSTDEVKLWTVTANGASSSGSYEIGKLYKSTTYDENWEGGSNVEGMVETFTDLEGRVILKRIWKSASEKFNTYYIYDDLGNLRYVVPPAVTANSFTETDTVFDQFIYGYHYDGKRRVIEKKIPGKGWEHIVYNKLDQVVLTQDGVQRSKNEWYFSKYDALGRNILSGPLSSSVSRLAWQGLIDSLSNPYLWEERDNANAGGTNTGYTNRSLPTSGIIVYHTINYFDDYAYFGWGSGYSANGLASSRTKGLSTGVKVLVPGIDHYMLTVPYYDEDGRVVETISNNHLSGTDRVKNTYNFAGELTASTRTHTDVSANQTIIANRFTYDHVGRKLKSYSKIGNSGSTEVLLSELTYNEIGQLKQKQLHSDDGGATFKQATKFAYNERGWLKNSASPQFSMKLGYDTLSNPQYNGNIRTQLWGIGYGNTFDYGYDKLNRLTSALSSGVTMNEAIAYDAMGNINSLTRDGVTGNYNYNGNRLSNISGGLGTGTYEYDANGNVITDGRTGFKFGYNQLNLPIEAVKPGLILIYNYAADGRKMRKLAITSGTITTDYVDGIQYTNGVIDFIQTEEGRALNSGGTYSYQYNLTDHLGNVRYSFDIHGGTVRPLQEDDYYAFGLRRSARVGTNKYLYNGKELQEELDGQYDYGARFYDPVIGRWNAVDPLAESYQPFSPYNYVLNNPLANIDPDGRSVWAGQAERNTLGLSDKRQPDELSIDPWTLISILYNVAEDKLKTGFGVITAIEGAQDKARNVAQQQDPGFDGLPDKTKAIIIKGTDREANNKMGKGGVEFANATLGTAGTLLGGVEGTLGRFTTKVVSKTAISASSEYIESTGKNSIRNIQTNVTASEFGVNLEKSGFTKSISKDGRVTNFINGGSKYSVKLEPQTSRGTPGASADYSNGTHQPTLKIRLKGGNN